eukprot:178945-Prymnesium_polylepis.1
MLSEYEVARQQTIAENNAKLADLGLGPVAPLIVPQDKTAGARKKRAAVAPLASPQRRSSRIRREPAAQLYVEAEEEASGKVTVAGAAAAEWSAELAADDEEDPDAVPTSPSQLSQSEKEVYEIIREARNAKARSLARSMFIVCQNRTMVEMVRLLPSTVDELHGLYGMGDLKVARYGELLLGALRPHVDKLQAERQEQERQASEEAGTGAGASAAIVD